MAHVAQAKQENMFYDYVDEDLTLWQAFFLILWSFCVCMQGFWDFSNAKWGMACTSLEAI
jgi:hypothetical protein